MRATGYSMLLTIVLSACATNAPGDDAVDGAFDLSGKADGPSFAGTYQEVGGGARKGDLPFVQLHDDGTYVRLRCYTTNCTKTTPETDRYTTFENPDTHKQYVIFGRFVWTDFDNRESRVDPYDAYEVRHDGANLLFRKTYTSRWIAMAPVTEEAICTASGGTWDTSTEHQGAEAGTTTSCDCGQDSVTNWDDPIPAFVPGAGGCRMTFKMVESECDDTQGSYTDDDTDALGDYCLCPAGTIPTDTGCVAE